MNILMGARPLTARPITNASERMLPLTDSSADAYYRPNKIEVADIQLDAAGKWGVRAR